MVGRARASWVRLSPVPWLARIKVADSPTYAYPVLAGNRIYIKDQDSVTLWTVE